MAGTYHKNCDKFPENIRHTPTPPFAFLEQGVAMLSSVLRSQTAIDVNISIMRAFRPHAANVNRLRGTS